MVVSNAMIVIGDCFPNFRDIPSCVLWKQMILCNQSLFENSVFIPGLGLSDSQIKDVALSISSEFGRVSVDLATKSQTHKHNSDNILVTKPIHKEGTKYESRLVLQDNNELLNDHTTGFHIQGMVFLEATRQMATSIVDDLFNDRSQYYVMHEIQATYLNISFPIETIIELELTQSDVEGREQAFTVHLNFYQNGKKVVSTNGNFTSVNKQQFLKKERRCAELVTRKFNSRFIKNLTSINVDERQFA